MLAAIRKCQDGQAAFECELCIQHEDGSLVWVLNRGEVVERDGDGTPVRMVGSLLDVSEQKRSARVMQHRTLLLQTIAAVNEMLMAGLPEQALMSGICQQLVRDDLFRMAWVGMVDENGVSVRPVAEAGFGAGYLAQANIRCDDSLQGQGPTGTAIRSGTTQINNDTETSQQFTLWRERRVPRATAHRQRCRCGCTARLSARSASMPMNRKRSARTR